MIEIEARVEIKPTEDENKVKAALDNILDYETLKLVEEEGVEFYVAKAYSLNALNKLANLIKKQRIELSARSVLEKSIEDGNLVFKLNKQAAYMNRVSFVTVEGEAPLGYIEMRIKSENLDDVIDYIAPKPVVKKVKFEPDRSLELQ